MQGRWTRMGGFRRVAALGVFGASLASGMSSPTAAQVLVKMGTVAPEGSAWHLIFKAMGEEWRKAPAGGVNLRIYAGGVLGDEPAMVRKMRVGQIHAAALTSAGLADIDKSVAAFQIPMMFRSYEELDFVRERLRPMLEERLEKKGFIVLHWGDAGWVMFFAKEPFTRPDELRERKLFVWAGDSYSVDLWKASGFHPVPLAFTDILPGLQTGLINALDTTPLAALANQWFGLAPHMLDLKWAPLVGATVITKRAWEKIPPVAREAVRAAAAAAGDRLKGEIRSADATAIEAMVKRGLTVHPAGPDVEAEWRLAAEGAYPRIRGTIVPAEIFDEVRRLSSEYRASREAPAQ